MAAFAEACAPTSDELASRVAGMSVGDPIQTQPASVLDGVAAGTSPVMRLMRAMIACPHKSMFRHGVVVVLQSVTSGRTLCIYEGQVSGKGIRDTYSQFIVHVRPPGRIALQNVANTDNWLGIYEGRTLGSGNGGPYSEFNLREVEDKYVALESSFYTGQHVGVGEEGELKPPAETPPRDRAALFIPFPHSAVTSKGYPMATPASQEVLPPYPGPNTSTQGGGYPAEMSAFAMTGTAVLPPNPAYVPSNLPSYVPPTHFAYVPQQQGPYLQTVASPPHAAVPQSPPAQPTIPLGYEIMDLFSEYNTFLIIPRVDVCARPLGVLRTLFGPTSLKAGGAFLSAECAFFAVFSSQGGLVLRPTSATHNAAVCVTDTKKVHVTELLNEGRGQDTIKREVQQSALSTSRPCSEFNNCHSARRAKKCQTAYGIDYEFAVRRVDGGGNVIFESLKFPGHYLCVGRDGTAKLDSLDVQRYEVQFTIRVLAFKGPYSTIITSPFARGTPSVVNQLKDRSVIQLYYKPTKSYVCLVEGGRVLPTPNEDKGTFLFYRDHGMGRVSLTGYYTGIQKLRMEMNGRLSSVGAEDVNMDFYVKESPNKTLLFESVPYPGKFVHLKFRGVKYQEFSIFLMDMNRQEIRGRQKTIPKYALN